MGRYNITYYVTLTSYTQKNGKAQVYEIYKVDHLS